METLAIQASEAKQSQTPALLALPNELLELIVQAVVEQPEDHTPEFDRATPESKSHHAILPIVRLGETCRLLHHIGHRALLKHGTFNLRIVWGDDPRIRAVIGKRELLVPQSFNARIEQLWLDGAGMDTLEGYGAGTARLEKLTTDSLRYPPTPEPVSGSPKNDSCFAFPSVRVLRYVLPAHAEVGGRYAILREVCEGTESFLWDWDLELWLPSADAMAMYVRFVTDSFPALEEFAVDRKPHPKVLSMFCRMAYNDCYEVMAEFEIVDRTIEALIRTLSEERKGKTRQPQET